MWSIARLLFISGAATTLAAPSRLLPRSVSVREESQFEVISQFAAAAYCEENTRSAGQYLACSAGNCPFVEHSSAWVTESFWNIGESNTIGFIAIDDTNHLIVLSFQGTANNINILTDSAFLPTSTELCGTGDDECKIHRGFWHAWLDVESLVTESMLRAGAAYPSYRMISTGHSLGGSLAALAAASLRNGGLSVDLYTYGQPRLGFETIAQYITNQAPSKGSNFRITHTNDIVPQLPQHKAGGWDHFSPEYYISSDEVPVRGESIQQVVGFFNESGNSGTEWPNTIDEVKAGHTRYFGNITACFSGARNTSADLTAELEFVGIPHSLLE